MGTDRGGAAADEPGAALDEPGGALDDRAGAVVVRGHAREDELAALLAVLGSLGPPSTAPAAEGFAAAWRRRRIAALRAPRPGRPRPRRPRA